MYCLSEQQIDFILNDIRARGVEMESLQLNLLDHICCIIEHQLEEKGDFETFYQQTIKTFYKDALWEIEEETIFLLTYKNYYHMKKTMITSGIFSAASMTIGIFFKFMHWPGANMLILLGIAISSIVFLPLLFTFKAREKKSTKEKIIVGLGILSGMLMSLSILFKLLHWPFSMTLGIISVSILGLIFLPIYFFHGIKQEDQKVNTITVSILIIMISGLWLTLIRTPRASRLTEIRDTNYFFTNEQIVKRAQKQNEKYQRNDTSRSIPLNMSHQIITTCQYLKNKIVEMETGHKVIDADFESKNLLLREQNGLSAFLNDSSASRVDELIIMIEQYNKLVGDNNSVGLEKIPTHASFVEFYKTGEMGMISLLGLLNQLSQVQLFVLQNERELLALK
jgi:hypothetical protein